MIAKFLDTEVSFVHYLTRRATLEDLIQIEGDEQDYLSLYLTNGLWQLSALSLGCPNCGVATFGRRKPQHL
ncbi:hypothetical protein AB9F35_35590, partial [Rhizobium leguminosarum]|uniref:hypothetical protein n=1 Tax=Rhizobium leguminosarum TaxID=384 RepID=UPI003F96A430